MHVCTYTSYWSLDGLDGIFLHLKEILLEIICTCNVTELVVNVCLSPPPQKKSIKIKLLPICNQVNILTYRVIAK